MIDDEIKESILEALADIYGKSEVERKDITEGIVLEHPKDLSHGDYSFAMMRITQTNLGTKRSIEKSHPGATILLNLTLPDAPKVQAQKLVAKLRLPKEIEKVEIAGVGFINFYLSKGFFSESVSEALRQAQGYGKTKVLGNAKVMVEYTDPNPFKEFHIGHLMSNAVGESIARLFEFRGAKVLRACWQGDVGLHVAKALWGMKQKFEARSSKLEEMDAKALGEAYVLGSEKFETDESAKKEITALNKVIYEKSDAEVDKLYDAGRTMSLKHFEEIYKILGTKFDYYFFEGREGREGQPIVEKGLAAGVFEKSDGAVVFKGEKRGLHTRVFITTQGLPTYETKELGLNKAKFEKEPDLDESIIVTANEQSDYFKVVLAAMKEVLPEVAKKTKHVTHGMLRFASGKMSSRTGNVITGESLIEQVKALVREKVRAREIPEPEKETLAEVVAVGAIKYSILRQGIGGDITFDFEKSISFEGDSGPYLQYSYVRARSVLAKATTEKIRASAELPENWETTVLEKLLYRFPEVVGRAGRELEPHYIATFIIELAGAFNSWYANEQIVDARDSTSPYKVALTEAFTVVMKNGLWLLGICTPEKM